MDRDEEGADDLELCVKLSDDLVYHVRDLPDPQAELHLLQIEEIWRRESASGNHLLGRGGFGSVYKEKCISDVRRAKMGQFRAVKVIEMGDQVTKAYYRGELRALAKFSAPRYRSWFVECFGWYEAMDRIFINMEHIEHLDLQRYLDRKFSEHETKRIASQVAKGLGFMHRSNFIHRDLKPANLLVVEKAPEKEWWVKISDFGISKRSTDGRLAYSTAHIGTQDYMAPEVRLFTPRHKGEKASYTVAADMWSLGAICVCLITGSPAFDLRGLFEYFDRGAEFTPENTLSSNETTKEGRDFIRAIMDRDPKRRPSAQKAMEHPWMAPSWRLSPGVPNYEPKVLLATTSSPGSPELADEYRATAQWDSVVAVEQPAEDLTVRPAATTRQASRPVGAIQSPENIPASATRYLRDNRGRGYRVFDVEAQPVKDQTGTRPLLASGSLDGKVKIWDPAAGKCMSTLSGHKGPVYSVAWSHDAVRLASGSDDNTVKIRDPATGQCISTLSGHKGPVYSVTWSHDAARLASGSYDKKVKIWDPATGQCISTLEGHDNVVQSVAWSHDAARLASGSSDKKVKIWDPATGQCMSTLSGHKRSVYSVAWSHDAARLASGSYDKTVKIWDPATGQCISTLEGHDSMVRSVAWSHDAARLASGSRDETVKIWDPATGQCMSTLEGHDNGVRLVAWSHP